MLYNWRRQQMQMIGFHRFVWPKKEYSSSNLHSTVPLDIILYSVDVSTVRAGGIDIGRGPTTPMDLTFIMSSCYLNLYKENWNGIVLSTFFT